MRISTRGRYGLRAMLELALNYDNGPVLMSTIAQNQALSRKYLHALLTLLKEEGLVRSVRGVGGGYALNKPPSEIKLGEIVQILEGTLSLITCLANGEACGRAEHCVAQRVWREVNRAIEDTLNSITLEDLANWEREREQNPQSQKYSI